MNGDGIGMGDVFRKEPSSIMTVEADVMQRNRDCCDAEKKDRCSEKMDSMKSNEKGAKVLSAKVLWAAMGCLIVSVLFVPSLVGQSMATAHSVRAPIGKRYTYKQMGDRDLSLYVVFPSNALATQRRRAILFFHGGGWIGGPLNQFDRQARYLASRGLVAIQVEYRVVPANSTETIDPAIEDAKSAMRWVRAHAHELGIDGQEIGAAGGSAGGQLAAFLGMMDGKDDPGDDLSISARPQIMILYNPAIDLGPEGIPAHGGKDYKDLSPRYHVHANIPPTLILQGRADVQVSPVMITHFAEEMKAAGNDCTLVLYPNAGHGFFNSNTFFYKTLEQMDLFLSSHGWLQGPPNIKEIYSLPPTL